MKVKDLVQLDKSIKVISGSEWPEEILAISSLDRPNKNGFLFVKNRKFLSKFFDSIETISNLKNGLVIEDKLYLQLNTDELKKFEGLPFLISTPSVPMSLTLFSKPFFDLKMKDINYQVDGRQMGTCDIDPTSRISQNVFIGEYVKIGRDVVIMPGCVILPHVEIGDGTTIHSNVTIYPFTSIGKNCRIHSGVVIGSDGFGYTYFQGEHLKIWHMGGVEIKNNVEIGANSAIDMGTFSPTIIGEGTKIDNLVQIAHNTKIGKACVICGQSGVAGSAVLEDYVVLAGRVAIGPDAVIGKGSQVAGGAKVNEGAQWPAGSKLGGHPAKDLKEWMRGVAYLRNMSLRDKK